MHSQTSGAMAPPKSSRKFLLKIAYLIVVVPVVLLFFALVVGVPD